MLQQLNVAAPGQSLQRERRSGRFFTDQHGRKFYAEADALSQQPIGEMRPHGWKAEWLPPSRYAKFRRDGDLHFEWQYLPMADELSADVASYYEAATKFALEHNLPVPDVGGVVDRRISAVFGPAPLSPEIPLAAEAGDPGLLGTPGAVLSDDLKLILRQGTISTGHDALRQIKDRIAQRMGTATEPFQTVGATMIPMGAENTTFAPVTYQSFMSEARKNGMSMADIALAWKAHKENSVPAEATL